MKKRHKVAEVAAKLADEGKVKEATAILEGFLTTRIPKEASTPGLRITSVEVNHPPMDDLDDEFIFPADVYFEVTEPLVSKLFRKQSRVIDRFLKKVTERQAFHALTDGPLADLVLKEVSPLIKKETSYMARDEFGRGARVLNIDFSDSHDYWEARRYPLEKKVTYMIQFDVMGLWR